MSGSNEQVIHMIRIPPKSPQKLSATWFAFAAYLVVLIIFRNTIISSYLDFFFWQILPIVICGLVSFFLGPKILDSEKVRKPIEAIGIGINVSLITYFIYFIGASALISIASIIRWNEVGLGWLLYSFLNITFYYGWLILAGGATAGWLLFYLFRQKNVGE